VCGAAAVTRRTRKPPPSTRSHGTAFGELELGATALWRLAIMVRMHSDIPGTAASTFRLGRRPLLPLLLPCGRLILTFLPAALGHREPLGVAAMHASNGCMRTPVTF
jgi:hypothetical protein